MRAAAAGEGGGDGGAEGAGLSVSPEYIDALVEAAREPTMGERTSTCGGAVGVWVRFSEPPQLLDVNAGATML